MSSPLSAASHSHHAWSMVSLNMKTVLREPLHLVAGAMTCRWLQIRVHIRVGALHQAGLGCSAYQERAAGACNCLWAIVGGPCLCMCSAMPQCLDLHVIMNDEARDRPFCHCPSAHAATSAAAHDLQPQSLHTCCCFAAFHCCKLSGFCSLLTLDPPCTELCS